MQVIDIVIDVLYHRCKLSQRRVLGIMLKKLAIQAFHEVEQPIMKLYYRWSPGAELLCLHMAAVMSERWSCPRK